MNSFNFHATTGPILVDAEITGPRGSTVANLVLDTGATISLIKLAILISLGFDPHQSTRSVSMTTGTTTKVVPLVTLTRLSALGQHRFGFPAIAHTLPTAPGVDGLLGLDFLRNQVLTIDFTLGPLSLT